MRKEYDFSKAVRSPYPKMLKRQITIRIDHGTIAYFKSAAGLVGMPYQSLINLYLKDCVKKKRTLRFT
jgi:predicted DNA binding CopG/RHH family protein